MNTPAWLSTAFKECGVDEGDRNRIAEYLSAVGIAYDNQVPWCAAFVAWALKESGMVYLTSARARTWMTYGIDITDYPKYGSVVVMWRISPTNQFGHVGFYLGHDTNHVWVYGGNQSDSVKVQPYPINQVLGYRWPTTERIVL